MCGATAIHGSRDVGLDRERTIAELRGERLDSVGAARQQREPVTVGGQRPRGGLADTGGRASDDRNAAGALISAS